MYMARRITAPWGREGRGQWRGEGKGGKEKGKKIIVYGTAHNRALGEGSVGGSGGEREREARGRETKQIYKARARGRETK